MIDYESTTWSRKLSVGDTVERRIAAETLGAVGTDAADALPGIVQHSITDAEPPVSAPSTRWSPSTSACASAASS